MRLSRPCKFHQILAAHKFSSCLLFRFFFFQFSLVCQWSKLNSTLANTSYWSTSRDESRSTHLSLHKKKKQQMPTKWKTIFNGHREQDVFLFLLFFAQSTHRENQNIKCFFVLEKFLNFVCSDATTHHVYSHLHLFFLLFSHFCIRGHALIQCQIFW